MEEQKDQDWFKIKRYPHIGFRLKEKDKLVWIESYVTNPDMIEKHSFLPFIHKTSKVRRYRKEYDTEDGKLTFPILSNKKNVRVAKQKNRELFYASHLDSLIYNYYSDILMSKYEKKILEYSLSNVVNAYRSIPLDILNPTGSKKCNIDFANDAFKLIKSYNADKFIAIAFDIKGFFDNLNHKVIRDVWCDLLETPRGELPLDHFNVYKNITRYSYVDLIDIFKCFQNKIYVEEGKSKIRQKRISKIKYLKKEHACAFCSKKEFIKNKNILLRNTKRIKLEDGSTVFRNFGIPQGSPISSVIANSYLLDFDKKINDFIEGVDGIYRRYSDDMVVICSEDSKDAIILLMKKEIRRVNLELQEKKTQVFHFQRKEGKLICGQEFKNGINWNKKFIYLGFEFDGETILLKSGSLSNYYRKMKRTIRRAKHFANSPYNTHSNDIFKRRIFRKFSYKGAYRRRRWYFDKNLDKYVPSDSYDWGNFLTYVYKASDRMDSKKIRGQVKRHWQKLDRELR